MSKVSVKIVHKPILGPERVIYYSKMDQMLRALPISWKEIDLDDYNFYIPSWDDWRKIFEYLQPKVPKYRPERKDCEFLARWFYVRVCEDFDINSLAMAEGWRIGNDGVPRRHTWNIFLDPDAEVFLQYDAQTGSVLDIDDPVYKPDEITMG